LRILYVVHQFFPYFVTGVERNTLNLSRQMRLMGHETLVLSVVPSGHEPEETPRNYLYRGCRVIQQSPSRATKAVPDCEVDEATAEILRSVISSFKPHVVHVMHPRFFPEARLVAHAAAVPAVLHLHDYWFVCPRINFLRADGSLCSDAGHGRDCETLCGMDPRWGTQRYAWAVEELARYDAVISPSRFLIETFSLNGFSTKQWHHIPYGVDYRGLSKQTARERWPRGAEEPADASRSADGHPDLPRRHQRPRKFDDRNPMVVRFLGTILRHKGPHVLLEAVKALPPDAPVLAAVHGSSYHESDYEKELREMAGEDPRIVFSGAYAYERIVQILEDTDLVVVPSLWHENFPITAETATAFDVPIACSDLGGMAELVSEYQAGFTFRAGDSDALAAIIEKCLADPALLELPSDRLKPPPLEEEAARIEQIYRQVVC
jgi:glycosyltransferase involved in cell wall biosynthesis